MSIKSMTLVGSLLIILSFHSNPARADYTSPGVAADDEIEGIQARQAMAALLFDDHAKPPVLSEITEPPSQKLSQMRLQKEAEIALAEQNVTDIITLPWISQTLAEDYNASLFAKQIGFSPTGIEVALDLRFKDKSLKEKVKSALDEMNLNAYFWDQLN